MMPHASARAFVTLLLITTAIPAHAGERIEKIDSARVAIAKNGVVSLDGKSLGVPNDSCFWDKHLDSVGAKVRGPEGRPLVEFAAAPLSDGKLMVVSGGESVHFPFAVSNLIDLNHWTTQEPVWGSQPAREVGPKPAFARLEGSAVRLLDGRILVSGGAGAYPYTDLITTPELYDPVAKEFTSIVFRSLPRREGVATLLADGRVLITGGWAGDGHTFTLENRAEIFDPKTHHFEVVGQMFKPRYLHAAVLLPDGRVMIVGGAFPGGGYGPHSLPIEYFDPKTNSFSKGSIDGPAVNFPLLMARPDGTVLMTRGISEQSGEGEMDGKPTKITGYFPSAQSWLIHSD